jgi:hypothetical protein
MNLMITEKMMNLTPSYLFVLCVMLIALNAYTSQQISSCALDIKPLPGNLEK